MKVRKKLGERRSTGDSSKLTVTLCDLSPGRMLAAACGRVWSDRLGLRSDPPGRIGGSPGRDSIDNPVGRVAAMFLDGLRD
jgi:hypothetical protein